MGKKNKPVKYQPRAKSRGFEFNPDNIPYFPLILFAVMAIAVIILFSEFLFSDKMLHGSDTITAGVFFRDFYVEYVKTHGSVPVWNPYIFGGMPFIDAFHGDIFYPLSALKFFGNFYRMLGINLVLHIFLSGIFMFFTARQFKLGNLSSSLAALAYMFSGLLVSWVSPGHDGKIFVATLFPLTMLFLDRAFERKPLLNFTLLGLVIGFIILSPHAQLSYYTLWAVALYGAYRIIMLFLETKSVVKSLKPAGLLTYAVIVGLLISAIQFYPGYIYTTEYSPRADSKKGYDWATSWSMSAEEAASLIVPEFSGTQSGEGNYYWGKNAFKDNSEYTGVIPLFLALIGFFFARKRRAYFFGGLAIFALIYALGDSTPFFKLFFYTIPNVKSLRAPSTIMFIFLFSASLLAGYGLQYIIDKSRELKSDVSKKLKIYLAVVPGALILFALLYAAAGESMLSLYSSIFYSDILSIPVGQGVTKWNLALMQLPNIQSGLWIVGIFTTIVSAAVYLYISKKAGVAVLVLLPLLAMIDGLRFDSKFISNYDYTRQFTPNPLTDYFNSLPGEFRVFNAHALPDDYLPYFGIEVVVGYHGNQLRWYDDLLGGPNKTNESNPAFLNLTGAKYIVIPSSQQIMPTAFGPDSLIPAKVMGGFTVYQNNNALPRAFMVDNYRVIPDRKDIYPLILSREIDPLSEVVLEVEPEIKPSSGDSLMGMAEIISHEIDSVAVSVNAPGNRLLVLTDNYYFAWEAFIDGETADLMRAFGSFRAVSVPAGTHMVVFRYNKARNNLARLVTLLTLLGVAIILLSYTIRYFIERKKVPKAA